MTAVEQKPTAGHDPAPTFEPQFPNFWSRWIAGPMFRRQFIIPEQPPRMLESFLCWYERNILKPDISKIPLTRPCFLIGLPRSGTSMLQDIICAHPQLAYITNSMHQFRKCFCAVEVLRKRFRIDAKGQRYLGDSVEVEAGSPNDAVAFWAEWFLADLHGLEYVPRKLADFDPQHIEGVKQSIRKIIWCFPKASRFFSKNPGLVTEVTLLKELFPDAKFVHIVRDPRLCANSIKKLYRLEQEQLERIRPEVRHGTFDDRPFVPYPRTPNLARFVQEYGADDIRCTAHLWRDAVEFLNQHRDQLAPNWIEVRYEDICQDPKKEVFKILEFYELDPIREDNERFWKLINAVGRVHHTNKYDSFDVVEDICRDWMVHYGYL